MSICVVLFENCGSEVPSALLENCGEGCSSSTNGDGSFSSANGGSGFSSEGGGSTFAGGSTGGSGSGGGTFGGGSGDGGSFGNGGGDGDLTGEEENYGQLDYHQYRINSHRQNFNIQNHFGHKLKAKYTIIINVDVNIGSNNANVPAFSTGNLPRGSEVTLINMGTIAGKGGHGGSAYTSSSTKRPGNGGVAIETKVPLSINNYGRIYGGGGGGTGGLATTVSRYGSSCTTGGHGGGGGAGYPGGRGGSAIFDSCNSRDSESGDNYIYRYNGVSGTSRSGGGTEQWIQEQPYDEDNSYSWVRSIHAGGNLGQKGTGPYGGLPGASVKSNSQSVSFTRRGTVLGPEQ